MGCIMSEQVLYFEIQCTNMGKEEVENWRKRTRHPSVPFDSLQLAPQQAPRVDHGFDPSITSFPLLCLSSDGSRLYPSIAEPTPSVPPFALALSLSRTLQARSGGLSHSNMASFVLREELFPARHSLPFLLDQSLLTVPV